MSKNLMEQFLEDSVSVPSVTDTELTEISRLAEEQLRLEALVTQLEANLAEQKETLRHVSEFLLPEAMAAVGMSEFKLKNGFKITVKDDVAASIKKEFTGCAVDWLDSNGFGDIVKDQIQINLARGQLDAAEAIMEYCRMQGHTAEEKFSVHPQTLKAFVKEQMAHGVEFPEQYFSIYSYRKAAIKK